jgi:hypothetical protein
MAESEQSFEERVRQRAYELWEEAGRPVGRADDYWRQARAELEGKAAERGGNPPSELEEPCDQHPNANVPTATPRKPSIYWRFRALWQRLRHAR